MDVMSAELAEVHVDENIDSLASADQLSFPLHRFVESLCFPLDELNQLASDFDYVRETQGVEKKSTLTDPASVPEQFLEWLACVTGSSLSSLYSGFTPWEALEAYDSADANIEPGQWSDIDPTDGTGFANWSTIQAFDPNFFNVIQGYRDQLQLGVFGVNAGRPDIIDAYIRTFLNSETPGTDVVVVENYDKGDNYKIKVLVDPLVDPDPDGDLINDEVLKSLPVGTVSRKVGSVDQSGQGALDVSKVLYPAVPSSTSSAKGVAVFDRAFVSDSDNYGRTLLLNVVPDDMVLDTARPELGGGLTASHFVDGSCLAYGKFANNSFAGAITDPDVSCDFGGSAAFDVVMVLTDVTPPSTTVDTAGDGGNSPADWFLREKRLIVCGVDDAGTDNDWAIYLASGLTPGSDSSCRLLFVDGYNTSASNYAYSDPIDFSKLQKTVVFRVKRSAVSGGSTTVTFYAQSSLYDDWESNVAGTDTITAGSTSAGASACVQVLGDLTSSWTWASADPLSCAVQRVMLFASPLTFTGSGPSTSANAVLDGELASTCESFVYDPTVDLDFSVQDVYDAQFTLPGGLGVALFESSPQASMLAMRTDKQTVPVDIWYFGTSSNSGSGNNVLSVAGLSASTSYDVKFSVLNVLTGAVTAYTTAISTDGSGVLSTDVTTVYTGASTLNGVSLTQIEVFATGTVTPTLAKFTPLLLDTVDSAADTYSKTWTVQRTFPVSTAVEFAPAQTVTRDAVHMFYGGPSMANPPQLETFKPFSVAFSVRRHWTGSAGTIYDVLRLLNDPDDTAGFHVYFDGPKLKVEFLDGSVDNLSQPIVETLETSAVDFPDVAYREWADVVIRRSAAANTFSIVVNGDFDKEATSTISANAIMPVLNKFILGFGSGAECVPRFSISNLVFFDRFLSDAEISLLVNNF